MRLFFALWPDAAAAAMLARLARHVAEARDGRTAPDANLHVTVAFVGSTRVDRVQAIGEAGARACERAGPFDLSLDTLGGTAHGIAWLAASRIPDALSRLHAALIERLAAAGVSTEVRAYRPHVTLARRCARRAGDAGVEPVTWRVEAMSLVASTPRPGGSRYDDLASWPLDGDKR